MLKVTIELTGKTWDDVDEALGEVTRFLKEHYRCGAEEEEEGNSSYSFDVTG